MPPPSAALDVHHRSLISGVLLFGFMIFTPGQLHNRAELYYQLGQLLVAGIPLQQALERFQKHPPVRSYRRPIGKLLEGLNEGSGFSESLRGVHGWLPELDIAILQAGEQSGRLDGSLRVLADYYRSRAQAARQFISDLLYPAFLLHFAIFVLPFPDLFITGNIEAYLSQTALVLIPMYLAIALLVFAMQSGHSEFWRALVEQLLRAVPVLGKGRKSLALSRLSIALESLLNAGVNIVQAWELAAAASGSPALKRIVRRWRKPLDEGATPAELIGRNSYFPEIFASQYASGEVSGKLDEMLRRLHEYYQEEGSRRLRALAQWLPRFVYLLIALYVGYRIISFWQGYFNQLKGIGEF